jgi:hypothetical protein
VIRRVQLLDEKSRSSEHRLAAIGDRIRDGLLRDNRVVPAVVGFLALLIFAWLIAGAIIGGPGEEERASNQASFAQGEDSESGGSETPAPGVENRDTDSFSAFESKDPFRSIIPKAGEDNNGSTPSQGAGNQGGSSSSSGSSKSGSSSGGSPKSGSSSNGSSKSGSSSSGSSKSGSSSSGSSSGGRPGGGGAGQDSTDQSLPGAGQDGSAQPGAPQGGPAGLFNSGGDLLPP